ncbi:MAG: aldehyde dehydrogenase family protein, partial [Planctomycetota bacterium]
AAQSAIEARVDHIVATGSSATGRAVARAAAETLTPCTLECSGSDAVIVLPGADTDRVAQCVAWGLTLNAGATCIGPRRLLAVGDEPSDRIIDRLDPDATWSVPEAVAEAVRRVVGSEIDGGAKWYSPAGFDRAKLDAACDARQLPAMVLMSGLDDPAIAKSDLFAPVLSLDMARNAEEAVRLANASPYALGASVFGPAAEALAVAKRLRAGCVTVNDLIAPTADPDLPFGGTGESGYGVTRGAEGLLAMTRPQAIIRRRGNWLPHLDKPTPALDDLIAGLIQSQHQTGLAARLRGMRRLIAAAMAHRKHK